LLPWRLAAKLADTSVGASFLPNLWSTYYEHFHGVLSTELNLLAQRRTESSSLEFPDWQLRESLPKEVTDNLQAFHKRVEDVTCRLWRDACD